MIKKTDILQDRWTELKEKIKCIYSRRRPGMDARIQVTSKDVKLLHPADWIPASLQGRHAMV
jgi:hypothetical protein